VSPVSVSAVPRAEVEAELARLLGGRAVARDAHGKPQVVAVAGGPELHFNLSHSGEWALIAVCEDSPVGVDIERPRVFRNPLGLAQRLCSARELEHVRGGEDQAGLLRLWVRKEAVAKADGGGLLMALGELDVLDPIVRGEWMVQDLDAPAPGYVAAVAWRADR
jgi:4'-phosphopantetheinyl transferase